MASNTLGVDVIDVSEAELSEKAKLDDALRVLKNDWINTPTDEGSISSSIEFYFEGDLRKAINAESAGDDIPMLGWSPFLNMSHNAFTFDVLCDSTVSTFNAFSYRMPSPGAKT